MKMTLNESESNKMFKNTIAILSVFALTTLLFIQIVTAQRPELVLSKTSNQITFQTTVPSASQTTAQSSTQTDNLLTQQTPNKSTAQPSAQFSYPYSSQTINQIGAQLTGMTSAQSSVLTSKQTSDQTTFEKWLLEGQTYYQSGKSIPQLIEFYAQKQLGIPYIGGLLEVPKRETLIVTLEGSDCVLFVEHSLALTLTTLQNSTSYSDLSKNIALLRYQNGQVEGYASRLHYFSDWLKTNQDKGVLDILHKNISSLPLLDPVNFMTSNRSAYRQLTDSDSLFQLMKERETYLLSNQIRYIPEHRIKEFEQTFQTGDILSFVSTINGLDIAHTALIVKEGDRVGFYHASTTGKVIKEPKTLFDYTNDRRNVQGIIVARLVGPIQQ